MVRARIASRRSTQLGIIPLPLCKESSFERAVHSRLPFQGFTVRSHRVGCYPLFSYADPYSGFYWWFDIAIERYINRWHSHQMTIGWIEAKRQQHLIAVIIIRALIYYTSSTYEVWTVELNILYYSISTLGQLRLFSQVRLQTFVEYQYHDTFIFIVGEPYK